LLFQLNANRWSLAIVLSLLCAGLVMNSAKVVRAQSDDKAETQTTDAGRLAVLDDSRSFVDARSESRRDAKPLFVFLTSQT